MTSPVWMVASSNCVSFAINVAHLDDNAVVVVVGELDLSSATELASVLAELIASASAEVVIDLLELSFIDSSGIAVLVSAQESLSKQGRRLTVRSPKPQASKIFGITGLSEYLNVQTSRSDTAGA